MVKAKTHMRDAHGVGPDYPAAEVADAVALVERVVRKADSAAAVNKEPGYEKWTPYKRVLQIYLATQVPGGGDATISNTNMVGMVDSHVKAKLAGVAPVPAAAPAPAARKVAPPAKKVKNPTAKKAKAPAKGKGALATGKKKAAPKKVTVAQRVVKTARKPRK